MAGGGDTHSLVKGNLVHLLKGAFAKRPCRVYDSDMKVKIEATGLNTFPDASIVCGRPRFKNEKRTTLLNPEAIFEVLSEGTEAYDRGEKFWNYRHLPALGTFVLVATTQPLVEVFERAEDGSWNMTPFDGLDATMRLRHFDVELPLMAIYEKTALDPATPPDGED
jgi:Uma2 family endonuclease